MEKESPVVSVVVLTRKQLKKQKKALYLAEKKRIESETGRKRKSRNQRDGHVKETEESTQETTWSYHSCPPNCNTDRSHLINDTDTDTGPTNEFKCMQRRVVPYTHTFKSYAKGRWCGEPLLPLLLHQFGGYSEAYYKRALKAGFIRVNGKIQDERYVIKNGDYLEHIMHRHEAPVHVPAQLDGIVQYKDERIVIVNKPASVPVHPGGSYRYNSLIFLLRHELNIPDLYPVHRIDRLTSGLLIFGTSSINTRDISEEIMKGQVRKFYLAKVLGEFPLMDDGMKHTSDGDYDAIGTFLPNHLPIGDVRKTNNGFWKLSAPIGCISAKENLRGVTEDGKESETLFRRLAFDGKHSIVQCIPLTGRTHQIRLHLRLLGFPIGNDPVYGPKSFLEELNRLEESEVVTQFSSTNKNSKVNDEEREEREPTVEKYCEVCVKGEVACFNWIQRKCLGMWLHSYRYEGPTWQYQVDLPPWASSVKHLV